MSSPAAERAEEDFRRCTGHLYYGLHKTNGEWIFRECIPNATEKFLSLATSRAGKLRKNLRLPKNITATGDYFPLDNLKHEQKYKSFVKWSGGEAYRASSTVTEWFRTKRRKYSMLKFWSPLQPYSMEKSGLQAIVHQPADIRSPRGMTSSRKR